VTEHADLFMTTYSVGREGGGGERKGGEGVGGREGEGTQTPSHMSGLRS